MAWAAAHAGRMHLVGGYGEQRVDRPYHHVYDPARRPLDRGGAVAARRQPCRRRRRSTASSTPSAASSSRTASRTTNASCWETAADAWRKIAPLPRACGAIGCVALGGKLHARRRRDRRHLRDQALGRLAPRLRPAARPLGDAARRCRPRATTPARSRSSGRIHVIGGRVDTFHTNSNLHHVYDPQGRQVGGRARRCPTARSGHGAVLYRGKIFCMGGEGYEPRLRPERGLRPATRLAGSSTRR